MLPLPGYPASYYYDFKSNSVKSISSALMKLDREINEDFRGVFTSGSEQAKKIAKIIRTVSCVFAILGVGTTGVGGILLASTSNNSLEIVSMILIMIGFISCFFGLIVLVCRPCCTPKEDE
ncbi:MAG: hypothetical protein AMS24_01445 [Chlamydiae bacterium SM23_39]|nr:MAG: hypothetical protein AMS24_01445 [Chlamydiae bacterium SM23_39]